MSENCIFCKIANGEIPTEFVYESKTVVVFKDIAPKAPIHLLVVPKVHVESLGELEDEKLAQDLFVAIKEVTKKLNLKEFRTVANTGKQAGQEVFHLHIHILSGKQLGDIC